MNKILIHITVYMFASTVNAICINAEKKNVNANENNLEQMKDRSNEFILEHLERNSKTLEEEEKIELLILLDKRGVGLAGYALGNLYRSKGDCDKAISYYKNSIRNKENYFTLYSLGMVLIEVRNYKDAYYYLQKSWSYGHYSALAELLTNKKLRGFWDDEKFETSLVCYMQFVSKETNIYNKLNSIYLQNNFESQGGSYGCSAGVWKKIVK